MSGASMDDFVTVGADHKSRIETQSLFHFFHVFRGHGVNHLYRLVVLVDVTEVGRLVVLRTFDRWTVVSVINP